MYDVVCVACCVQMTCHNLRRVCRLPLLPLLPLLSLSRYSVTNSCMNWWIGRTSLQQHINAPPTVQKNHGDERLGCSVCHFHVDREVLRSVFFTVDREVLRSILVLKLDSTAANVDTLCGSPIVVTNAGTTTSSGPP